MADYLTTVLAAMRVKQTLLYLFNFCFFTEYEKHFLYEFFFSLDCLEHWNVDVVHNVSYTIYVIFVCTCEIHRFFIFIFLSSGKRKIDRIIFFFFSFVRRVSLTPLFIIIYYFFLVIPGINTKLFPQGIEHGGRFFFFFFFFCHSFRSLITYWMMFRSGCIVGCRRARILGQILWWC